MDSDDDSDRFSEEESSSDYEERRFNVNLQRIKENDPDTPVLSGKGNHHMIQNMTDEEWEELGRDVSNNSHLNALRLYSRALDDHKMSFLFRGLTRSTSIKEAALFSNGFGVAGLRSMVPFLQNANSLRSLDIDDSDIQSEGFNLLLRALRDSPIKELSCDRCGIESIEIDNERVPRYLTHLRLEGNKINTDGCRELSKLLQGADPTLTNLILEDNQIDDEGVAILVDALQNNTTLKNLWLRGNEGISFEGMRLFLQLVTNISSIKTTLRSNCTMQKLNVKKIRYQSLGTDVNERIQHYIDNALDINTGYENRPEAAGRTKVILTQLHSGTREKLANLLGVERSVYSEINPLHLPEVLALVGRCHGQGELYVALKSSIAGVISTVNRKECIQQQMAYHAAKLEELGAELASINEASEGHAVEAGESRSNKRRRKWWWGLWGGA